MTKNVLYECDGCGKAEEMIGGLLPEGYAAVTIERSFGTERETFVACDECDINVNLEVT